MMKKVIMVSLSSMLIMANVWSDEYYEPDNYEPDAYKEVGYQPQTYPLVDDDDEKNYEGVSYSIESEDYQEIGDEIEGYESQETDDEVDNDASQKATSETEVSENESYLEGISVIGSEKIAYLSIKGSKIPVKEGEKFTFSRDSGLGTWRVIRIKKNSVIFKARGSDLEEELHLHSRLPLLEREKSHFQETTEISPNENTRDENNSLAENARDENNSLYRLVRTPFGNFVVRDDAPITPASAPKTYKPSNTNTTVTQQNHEEIPPEHRVVRTPFGNFIAKDK